MRKEFILQKIYVHELSYSITYSEKQTHITYDPKPREFCCHWNLVANGTYLVSIGT